MNILILSDANSSHTQKWVFSLKNEGLNVRLFSLFKPTDVIEKKYKKLNVKVYYLDLLNDVKNLRTPNYTKLIYITSLFSLKRVIKSFSPNIIHAHYASSYGVLSYLLRFHPTIVSAWGSDIYDFPNKSLFNKWILKKVIKNSDCICSTSNAMKKIIQKNYHRKDCHVVPFGVDIDKFSLSPIKKIPFTVGTIKSIESHNGIETILDAAKIVVHDNKLSSIKFLIVGDGTMLETMKDKVKKLKLNNNIEFTGYIPHDNIVKYFQKLSVFVAMSRRESFGVSILEAASCGVPSITSNIGGLPEVNENLQTGFNIEVDDSKLLSEKIIELYNNIDLRNKMGFNARKRVESKFNWVQNVKEMIEIYEVTANEKFKY